MLLACRFLPLQSLDNPLSTEVMLKLLPVWVRPTFIPITLLPLMLPFETSPDPVFALAVMKNTGVEYVLLRVCFVLLL